LLWLWKLLNFYNLEWFVRFGFFWVDLLEDLFNFLLALSTSTTWLPAEACHILPATFITELVTTSTDHMVATSGLLHPKLTLRTFFKFRFLDKLNEEIEARINLLIEVVLRTRQSRMDVSA